MARLQISSADLFIARTCRGITQLSDAHLSEQRPCLRHVHAIEPLGEPVVDVADHPAAFVAPTLYREKMGQARRCSQFQGSSALSTGDVEGAPEPRLYRCSGLLASQPQFALEPVQLGLVVPLARPPDERPPLFQRG